MSQVSAAEASSAPDVPIEDVLIIFADVGQGDSTVIIDRATSLAMVIDCPAGQEDVVAGLLELHQASLHTAAVTHFDNDHSVGLVALVDELGAEQFLMRVVENETSAVRIQYKTVLAARKRTGMGLITADPEKARPLGRFRWRVLGPTAEVQLSSAVRSSSDRNRTSVILRIEIAELREGGLSRALLLAGDCDRTGWLDLLQRAESLRSELFRWPHHGAQISGRGLAGAGTGLSHDVLDAIDPDVVFMGIGSNNPYGHPDLSAIADIRARAGVTHYCSQVTRACAVTSLAGPTACAGSLRVTIDAAGSMTYDRPRDDHRKFVTETWLEPQCVVSRGRA